MKLSLNLKATYYAEHRFPWKWTFFQNLKRRAFLKNNSQISHENP